ncbi:ABC transporter ATP-binding protein [Stutzerimonas kirkiae]|uniref:dipeptide ABC transporter ATP-binding protein n=1 Tax=Stutzerimonas kirkiae TaxID=2211392 RepID=UPI0010382F0B|nr:ABC transporter ATP-binding protein [Stutzerimonas kirkiae]TBV16850.1 ABC transporter ATP-binding protein [Stutzerimonas kirkiae]
MSSQVSVSVADFSVAVAATGKLLVDRVSFAIAPGEVLGVIGDSGAGKTVLAKALAGWLGRDLAALGGTLRVGESSIAAPQLASMARGQRTRIGFVGGDPSSALNPTLTVGKQLMERLRAARPGIGRAEGRRRIVQLLSDVRIPSPEARLEEYPFQFSGGMLQRVMIVDALLGDPDFLVADNITQPLDVTVGAQILRLVRRVAREHRTAILYLTSSPAIARDVADRLLVFDQGAVVEEGESHALLGDPAHAATRRLIAQQPGLWRNVEARPVHSHEGVMPSMAVLDVAQTYHHQRRAVKAVRQATFDVFPGENFAIVGESGCGKSTLTRILAWLEIPEKGDIELFGQSLSFLPKKQLVKLRQQFQLLLQDPFNSLPPRMTIGRMIAEPLLIHQRLGKAQLRERVLAAMAEVGLDPALHDHLALNLNGAQRQRIAIARALILSPKLIILDETLSSLDPGEQQKLLELFDRLQKKHGLTYIFISHDLAMVRRSCDRIAVMYLGEMVEVTDNQTLFSNPGHPYTRALLSAVSTLEDNPFAASEYLLEGEPPSPIDVPQGCAFRTRCPRAMEICASVSPTLDRREGAAGYTACHLNRRPPAVESPLTRGLA